MSTFLIQRGDRAKRRRAVAHVARFDAHGNIGGAWCWHLSSWHRVFSSNVPWGLRVCKDCRKRMSGSDG